MLAPLPSQMTERLSTLVDPYTGKDLVAGKSVQEMTITGKQIHIKLQYLYPISRQIATIENEIKVLLNRSWPDYTVHLSVASRIPRHKVQNDLKPKSVIKNIIAVGSGKGGVGKSTVAVNLALALKGMGANVAILDADIYGPSQPRMLGKQGKQAHTYQKQLIPVQSHGIESISMGYLVEEDTPMIWRGPMVSGALLQLLNETAWQECDYLILDLPPGTGDIQLTMAQKLPIAGAVVVTTPQDISLIDAHKACKMFEKVSIPVLGIVENMSWHACSQCGHRDAIFGEGGGERMATTFGLPLLAQLPLDAKVQQSGDAGVPVVVADPDSALAAPFWEMAQRVAGRLACQPVDLAATLPKIVVT